MDRQTELSPADRILLNEYSWADQCSESDLKNYIRNVDGASEPPNRIFDLWVNQLYQRYLRFLHERRRFDKDVLILGPSDVTAIAKHNKDNNYEESVKILRDRGNILSQSPHGPRTILLLGPSWADSHFVVVRFKIGDGVDVYGHRPRDQRSAPSYGQPPFPAYGQPQFPGYGRFPFPGYGHRPQYNYSPPVVSDPVRTAYLEGWWRVICSTWPSFATLSTNHGTGSMGPLEEWRSVISEHTANSDRSLSVALVLRNVLLDKKNLRAYVEPSRMKTEMKQEVANLLERKRNGMLGIDSLPADQVVHDGKYAKDLTADELRAVSDPTARVDESYLGAIDHIPMYE